MSRRLLNSGLFILVIALFAVLLRLMPHPANFAPIGALAIIGGMLLPKKIAALSTVAVMVMSDLIIGLHPLIVWTWGSFALVAVLSSRFLGGRNIGASRLVISGMAGGTLFFVITNIGVWLQGDLYARTFQGLVACFTNALPFYRNTILGDVFYVAIFYVAYLCYVKLLTLRSPKSLSQTALEV